MQCRTFRNGEWVPKVPYPNRILARNAMREVCFREGWSLKLYKEYHCRVCRQYHWGRVSKRYYAPA